MPWETGAQLVAGLSPYESIERPVLAALARVAPDQAHLVETWVAEWRRRFPEDAIRAKAIVRLWLAVRFPAMDVRGMASQVFGQDDAVAEALDSVLLETTFRKQLDHFLTMAPL